MKFHLILAVLTAVFASVVAQYAAPWGLVGWVVFLSWAGFFAAGAGKEGFLKILVSSLVGLLGGYAVIELAAMSTMSNPMLIPVAVVIFVFVALGSCKCFFVPGSFIGCASYLGAGALPWETFISLVMGCVLGYATYFAAQKICR